jgi:hypothetical protein
MFLEVYLIWDTWFEMLSWDFMTTTSAGVARLRRSETGFITPITTWPYCGDQQVAPLRRSPSGTITPINNTFG